MVRQINESPTRRRLSQGQLENKNGNMHFGAVDRITTCTDRYPFKATGINEINAEDFHCSLTPHLRKHIKYQMPDHQISSYRELTDLNFVFLQ